MFAREFTRTGCELWGLSFVPKAIVRNDGRLGELQAAAKDLLPVVQIQPKCVCVCVLGFSAKEKWGKRVKAGVAEAKCEGQTEIGEAGEIWWMEINKRERKKKL